MRVFTALLLAVLMLSAGPAGGDQNDSRLPKLFASLAAAPTPEKAQLIERQIWQVWLRHDDERIEWLMQVGRRALADGGYDGALKIFNQIVIVAPDFSEAWNKRATVLYLMGDFAGSVRNIESTLALEPRHFGALSGLGLIYRAIDKPESALKVFEKTLEIHPRSANAREQIRQIREELAERRL